MEEAIRRAIARIDVVEGGQVLSRGTGALVAPGLVLTALHVVANRHQDPPQLIPGVVRLTFPGYTVEATVHPTLFDRRSDWALLTCEGPPGVHPLPLAELRSSGGPWETYGFPDANPRDGMVQGGNVENHRGDLEGVSAYQLFSRQAAAGNGAPVKGLSGGPMLVDGALVGVLRFALMKEGQAVAGTLYACPVTAALERAGDLLPSPDPCHGLPGFERRPLPGKPFRYLDRFNAADAEIFFGRNREIRDLYQKITAEDSPPVVLLYGQSGVGKSSFLDSGLLPRLSRYHEVRYVRRDPNRSLLATLLAAIRPAELAEDAATLAAAWRMVEARGGRPLVVVLDQLEEVYVRPSAEQPEEMEELFAALRELFGDAQNRPQGRLVLAFRKEWFPEIQKQLEVNGLDYGKVFLEGLDRDAILDVITGLERTPRLRERYGLEVEPGLAGVIADDLLADRDSPVAPTLQILLTRLWQAATAESEGKPRFTARLYDRLRTEGYLLGDFLDQQLEKLGRGKLPEEKVEMLGRHLDRQIERLEKDEGLGGWSALPDGERAEVIESGLVLDILAFHTTPLLTSQQRKDEEVVENYRHRAAIIPFLVQAMKRLFLLVDPGGDGEAARGSRLAHDTLAPLVRQRFDTSGLPGQRARRILEGRAKEWQDGRDGAPLDQVDLAILEPGLSGMRALLPHEERLLAASRRARGRRRRNLWLLRGAAALAVMAVAGTAVWALREADRAKLNNTTDQVASLLAVQPVDGLVLAINAVGDSLSRFGEVFGSLQTSLNWAVEEAREKNLFAHPTRAPVHAVVLSGDGKTIVSAGKDGVVRLWSLTGDPIRSMEGVYGEVTALAAGRDGTVATAWGDGKLRLWFGGGGGAPIDIGPTEALAFSPDGTLLASAGRDGAVRLWNLQGQPVGEPFLGHQGAAHAVVFSPDGELIASAGKDGTVRLWTREGRPVGEPMDDHGQVLSLAFSPDGKTLAAGCDDGGVVQWDREGKLAQPPMRPHEAAVTTLAFHPDGRTIVTGSADQTVLVSGVDGRPVIPAFRGPDSTVRSLLVLPDGSGVVAGSEDGTVRVIDLVASQITPSLRDADGQPFRKAIFSSDGGRLLTLSTKLRLYDLADHRELWNTDPGSVAPLVLAFSPDGQRIAAGLENGGVKLWDAAGKPLGGGWPGEGSPVLSVAFSRDGASLLTGDAGGTVRVRDTKDGRTLSTASGGKPVTVLALGADGRSFAGGTETGEIFFWDLQGKKGRAPLQAEGGDPIQTLAFSPDGRRLATGGADGRLRLWDLKEGREICWAKAHNFTVSTLDWSPDGLSLMTGGRDRFVRLWNLQCESLAELAGHRDAIAAVAFGPDGKIGASAGLDGSTRLWRTHWREWLRVACDRLRKHPVFTKPEDDRSRQARAVCEDLVWKN